MVLEKSPTIYLKATECPVESVTGNSLTIPSLLPLSSIILFSVYFYFLLLSLLSPLSTSCILTTPLKTMHTPSTTQPHPIPRIISPCYHSIAHTLHARRTHAEHTQHTRSTHAAHTQHTRSTHARTHARRTHAARTQQYTMLTSFILSFNFIL